MPSSERLKTAIGIGFTALAEEHIFTFMLSSPFTARNLVKEKQDEKEVRTDLYIALALSVGFSLLMAYLLQDFPTLIFGVILGLLMFYIYEERGRL